MIPRARLSIWPWTDRRFVAAAEEVLRLVRSDQGDHAGSALGALEAQRALRERGYPRARVIDRRTLDEALAQVVHWEVLRDGEIPTGRHDRAV